MLLTHISHLTSSLTSHIFPHISHLPSHLTSSLTSHIFPHISHLPSHLTSHISYLPHPSRLTSHISSLIITGILLVLRTSLNGTIFLFFIVFIIKKNERTESIFSFLFLTSSLMSKSVIRHADPKMTVMSQIIPIPLSKKDNTINAVFIEIRIPVAWIWL